MKPAESRQRRALLEQAREALGDLPTDRLYQVERLLQAAGSVDAVDPAVYEELERLVKLTKRRRT